MNIPALRLETLDLDWISENLERYNNGSELLPEASGIVYRLIEQIGEKVGVTEYERKGDAKKFDDVEHPRHYTDRSIQPLAAIEDWDLCHHLACVVKYIARYDKKPSGDPLEDLRKARFYLDRKIELES